MAYGEFEQFIRNLSRIMGVVGAQLQRDLTSRKRVARRWLTAEAAELLGIDVTCLSRLSNKGLKLPQGERGSTGESLTVAHFAQYVSLYYGLRVGEHLPTRSSAKTFIQQHWT